MPAAGLKPKTANLHSSTLDHFSHFSSLILFKFYKPLADIGLVGQRNPGPPPRPPGRGIFDGWGFFTRKLTKIGYLTGFKALLTSDHTKQECWNEKKNTVEKFHRHQYKTREYTCYKEDDKDKKTVTLQY